MLKKTLIAMAVAGALVSSAGVLADSGTHADAHDTALVSSTETSMATSWSDTNGLTISSAGSTWPRLALDDEFDGVLTSQADSSFDSSDAVGSTSGTGGSGAVAFSSSGSTPAAMASIGTEEAYLVPAPLASADGGLPYWKVEINPASIREIDRLVTENVYLVTPIDDALVDPQLVLKYGADAYMTSDAEAHTGDDNSESS